MAHKAWYYMSAYALAVKHGYTGTEEEWLEYIKGEKGDQGIQGPRGYSNYEIAVANGYEGTEAEWLASVDSARTAAETAAINAESSREAAAGSATAALTRSNEAASSAERAAASATAAQVMAATPMVVTSTSAMTGTDGLYVLVDDQSEYDGYYYYYDTLNEVWVPGGAYNAVAVNTDTSLSTSGAAADAKATGSAMALVEAQIAEIAAGYNLVDNARFADVPDWSYSDDEGAYYGTAAKLSANASTTILRGINHKFKPNTRYKISYSAKAAANNGSGNGLRVFVTYTDSSTGAATTVKRNATTWGTYTAITDANKTVSVITITYSSGGTDVYYLKDFAVRENETATAIDRTARAIATDILPLQPTKDTTDRATEILNRLKETGHCELGAGDFYISSIEMPPDSKLSGAGNATRLIKLGADIDDNANFLTSDLGSISGVSYTPLGYVMTASQLNGQLTPRNAFSGSAGTAYKIHIRAQRVGGTPANEAGLAVTVTHHTQGGDPTTTYIAPNTFMRDGTLADFVYTTDASWIVDSVGFTYYHGSTDTWRISVCTIASEAYADGTGTAGYAIKIGHKCVLSDFALLGAEAEITPVATTVATPPANAGRDGIMLQGLNTDRVNDPGKRYYSLRNLFIANFSDSGIKAYGTGYATTSGAVITDVIVRRCGTGFQFNEYAEYFSCTGLRAHYCCVGIMVTGGNNFFSVCNIGNNQTNLLMDNSSGAMNNNSHGGFVGCTFNHSRGANWEDNGGYAFRAIKMTSGEIFTDCAFLGGGRIEIINSYGIIFNACNMFNMQSVTGVYLTITGDSNNSVKCTVMFVGCMFRNFANLGYSENGSPTVFFRNCLDGTKGVLIDSPPLP